MVNKNDNETKARANTIWAIQISAQVKYLKFVSILRQHIK